MGAAGAGGCNSGAGGIAGAPWAAGVQRVPHCPQERIAQWHDQSSRYSTELRDFKNQVITMMENMEKERERLHTEVETTAVRVERLEREVDYLETQNPALPCMEVDEKLVENQVATAKQRKNEKYDKLTGEPGMGSSGLGQALQGPDPCCIMLPSRCLPSTPRCGIVPRLPRCHGSAPRSCWQSHWGS